MGWTVFHLLQFFEYVKVILKSPNINVFLFTQLSKQQFLSHFSRAILDFWRKLSHCTEMLCQTIALSMQNWVSHVYQNKKLIFNFFRMLNKNTFPICNNNMIVFQSYKTSLVKCKKFFPYFSL